MKGADALILITEWNQFRRLDLQRVKKLLAQPLFFDLRNVYQPEEVANYGLDYVGVGLPEGQAVEAVREAVVSEE
jgi:UDPglucose 6-dehydrogenase